MSKLCYIDVETTGLSDYHNCIWQLACLIQEGPDVLGKFEAKMRPYEKRNSKGVVPYKIEDKALEVNGVTRGELMNFEDPRKVFDDFTNFLNQFIDPYKKKTDPEKEYYTFVAYNSDFDFKFIRDYFKAMGSKFMGTYFKYDLCVMNAFTHYNVLIGNPHWSPRKLEQAYNSMNLPPITQWHDAMADVTATFNLFNEMNARLLGLRQ